MATTIVHIADVHLETVFTEVRGGAARRIALAAAFERAVQLALERNADALTIGGDLFEAERAGPQTARFLFAALARFGRPVFIAPGNHDPFGARSLYARSDLPENVHAFGEPMWQQVTLSEDVTLYGFGHTAAEPGRPFAGARFDGSGARIALVHGSDEQRCPPNKHPTAPFSPADIRAAGATLALCGHFHGGYVHDDADGPVLAYPGSLEPIKFGEREPHGALVLTAHGSKIQLEAVPLANTHLHERTIFLDEATDESAVIAAAEQALAGFGATDYVRATLAGRLAPGTRVDPNLILQRMQHIGGLELRDRTATEGESLAEIATEDTVRGRAVAELLAQASNGDPDARRAAYLVAAAFSGAELRA